MTKLALILASANDTFILKRIDNEHHFAHYRYYSLLFLDLSTACDTDGDLILCGHLWSSYNLSYGSNSHNWLCLVLTQDILSSYILFAAVRIHLKGIIWPVFFVDYTKSSLLAFVVEHKHVVEIWTDVSRFYWCNLFCYESCISKPYVQHYTNFQLFHPFLYKRISQYSEGSIKYKLHLFTDILCNLPPSI